MSFTMHLLENSWRPAATLAKHEEEQCSTGSTKPQISIIRCGTPSPLAERGLDDFSLHKAMSGRRIAGAC